MSELDAIEGKILTLQRKVKGLILDAKKVSSEKLDFNTAFRGLDIVDINETIYLEDLVAFIGKVSRKRVRVLKEDQF